MKFVVLFEDAPGTSIDLRAKHMPEHLAFLQRSSANVDAAGPLKNQDGSAAGGLWIVDASDETEVRNLVEEDPFWATGLRKSVRVLSWTQVFADGQRLKSA
jgi:uncharacterized protein YciI